VSRFAWICLGGAVGTGARYLLSGLALAALGTAFPWGTLAVNLAGGLAMGLLAGWLSRGGGTEQARLFLAVGILGGFTTFSAFSLELGLMLQRGDYGLAAAYVLASVIGGVLLLFAGLWLMRGAFA